MKLVKNKLLRDVTLVDSPGMIDSVADERDYDFLTAVKWFVERADFVLFFFDPDKPGTTGESLNVFTQVSLLVLFENTSHLYLYTVLQ